MIGEIINKKIKLESNLKEGLISKIYFARNLETKKEYAIKFIKKDFISRRTEDLIRFKKAISSISKFKHENLLEIYSQGEFNQTPFIIMEYSSAQSLNEINQNAENVYNIDLIIRIAKQITKALIHVHSKNLIHRDLKPNHILINEKNNYEVKINDFAIAEIKDYSKLDHSNNLLVTFSYMAPEQFGVLKKRIDERSDLYSLGVTLYEMFGKKIPFYGEDLSEIIHKHIAQRPEPLYDINVKVPAIIDKIVSKLLEKEPEYRYQTAESLLSDLEKISSGYTEFIPGENSEKIKVRYQTSLVGRKQELEHLKTLYKQSLKKQGTICLIGGEPGRGKTRLVEELKEFVYQLHGNFYMGKFFSGENKTPYGPVIEILQNLIASINKLPVEKQKIKINKLKKITQNLGAIIARLVPCIKNLLGDFPDLVELEPEKENERFLYTISHFLLQYTKEFGPSVFHFDDIQWADDSTLDLLSEIASEIKNYPIVIVGTYRDNEITQKQKINSFMSQLKSITTNYNNIILDNFNTDKMFTFISNLLFESNENIRIISNFIFRKSKGNPFFAIEILKQLIEEKAIYRQDKTWKINDLVINSIEISSSIVDVLLKKISRLPDKDKRILSLAASIGRKFHINLLFELSDLTIEEIVEVVDNATKLQLLEQSISEKSKILFVHDRIREAFYEHLKPEEKLLLHNKIGETIENKNQNNIESVIFELMYHFIQAKNQDKILKYSYTAGIISKNNYANEDALNYLNIYSGLLEKNNEQKSKKWLEIQNHMADLYLLTGDNDFTIQICEKILPYYKDAFDKVKIYKKIGHAYLKKADYKNSEKFIKKALNLLNEKMPVTKTGVIFGILKEFVVHVFHNIFPFIFKRKKPAKKSRVQKLKISLYDTLNWSYIITDVFKLVKTSLRDLNLAESKIGISEELAMGQANYGAICMSIALFGRAEKYIKQALEIRKKLGNEKGVGQCRQFLGFCNQWNGNYKEAIINLKKGIEKYEKIGDIREKGICINGLYCTLYIIGDYYEAQKLNQEYLEISRRNNDNFGIAAGHADLALCFIETGRYEKAYKNAILSNFESKDNNIDFIYCTSSIELGKYYFEQTSFEKAINYFEQARELFEKNDFLKQYTVQLYPYLSNAYIENYLLNKTEMSNKAAKKLLKQIKRTCKKSIKITKNWITYYGYSLSILAKYYSIKGQNNKAKKLFEKSRTIYLEIGAKYYSAITLYEYGKYLTNVNDQDYAKQIMTEASKIFQVIGNQVYVRKIEKYINEIYYTSASIENLTNKQKLASIIKVSQDISSILNINVLLDKILYKAIEVTGAQNAYLFLYNNEKKIIELIDKKNVTRANVTIYSKDIVNEVFKTNTPILVNDAVNNAFYSSLDNVTEHNLKSILCTPIKRGNNINGVFYLDNNLSGGVFSEEDLNVINVFITQASIALENASLYENLEKKVEERTNELTTALNELKKKDLIMSEDLSMAKRIQTNILNHELGKNEKIDFHVHFQPMIEVGGDIYDISNLNPNIYRIFIADATGHGVQAALTTMIIKSEYDKIKFFEMSPNEILEIFNDAFIENYFNLNVFFTCVLVDIDVLNNKIAFSSAGHPTQYVVSKNQVVDIHAKGKMIGLLKKIKYELKTMIFEPGDKLLLFTDGLTEVHSKEKGELGEERLGKIIQKNKDKNIQDIILNLISEATHWKENEEIDDDITIVGMEYLS